MNIEYFHDYAAMNARGVSLVIEEVNRRPNLMLCAATGSSPLGLYRELSDNFNSQPNLFKEIRIIKLDEWVGFGKNAEETCEHYLINNLLKPLNISEDRYISFDPDTQNPEEDCIRMQGLLKENGPIDLCVLGLGRNGHLGFNEPGEYIQPNCHVAKLASASQQHAMVAKGNITPTHGVTLGMADILSSRRILVLVSGEGKEEAKDNLMSGKITTECPASFLWLHNNVDCLIMD